MAFVEPDSPTVDDLATRSGGQGRLPVLETSIQHLVDTNRALQSVVLELADLLKDNSRFALYPIPQLESEPLYGVPDSWEVLGRTRSRSSLLVRPKLGRPLEEADFAEPQGTFAEQNEQARARHEERRQKEMNRLRSKACYKYISYPSSFYQPEVNSYNQTRRYSARDPHQWWHRLHQPHRPDRKIRPGPHVQMATVGTYRDELLDALFDFDCVWPEQLVHTLPLRELEHTYGYKMHRIKAEHSCKHKISNELIITLGRFFQRISRFEKENPEIDTKDDAFRKAFSLQRLMVRCREYGFVDPEESDDVLFAKIWQVLWAFNHVAVLPVEPPACWKGDFILDILDRQYALEGTPITRPPLQSSSNDEDLHFSPKELGFKALAELGDLKIQWTNLYTQHLHLSRSSKTLLLFWDVSILGQSPLFAHYPLMYRQRGKQGDGPFPLSEYGTRSVKLLKELQRSYRIIFGNHKGRYLERFFRKHFSRTGDDTGIKLDNLENVMIGYPTTRVNISRSSARQALKYYLRAPLPKSVLDLRPELDLRKHRGPKQSFNIAINFKRQTRGKLMDLLDAGPPYPLDFWMHVSYLLELSQSSSLSEMETYSAYPIFGDRLRELKLYMDKQKPKNLKQLLKDRRDTVGYWAFWAVIVVGSLSIILTLVSIAFSSAQTVAAFKALGPLYRNTTTPPN